MSDPIINVLKGGDTNKTNPFTICIVANPALEAPWESGQFIEDPILSDQNAFDACASYIVDVLFGNLPGQAENFLGSEPEIGSRIRVVSIFAAVLTPEDSNSLVAQDGMSNTLVARRTSFLPFLQRFGLAADVAYAVSASVSHTRASAWFTTDDDDKAGVEFTLDGVKRCHRFYNQIPGTVGIHATANSLTALHEFGHALSSYSNGKVVDLYVDSSPGLNCKRGRPIPAAFGNYDGHQFLSDPSRNGLGYEPGWQSYHCELIAASFPAVMDDYWQSPDHVPEHCEHDGITRQFLMDRLRAKISR